VELHIEIILYLTCYDDFLGPCMRTFDDLSQIWIFVHLFELRCSCGKMAQNYPKWSKMLKIGQNYPKTPTNLQHLQTVQIQNHIIASLCCFGSFGVILGDLG